MWSRLVDKFGLLFISGFLLGVSAARVWSIPAGEMFAAVLLGASMVLLGFAAREWIETDRKDDK